MLLAMSALISDCGKPHVDLVNTSIYKQIQYVTSRHSKSMGKDGKL